MESQVLRSSGSLLRTLNHSVSATETNLTANLISIEALKTSEIEGEFRNRDSLQFSLRKQFGLDTYKRRISPSEQGIVEMMVDLYQTFDEPLSHEMLFRWYKMLTNGHKGLKDIGRYRMHKEPRQIISGPFQAAIAAMVSACEASFSDA